MKKLLFTALPIIILTGCASVQTTSVAYHASDFQYQGKSYSYHELPGEGGLPYAHASSLVDAQLSKYGLTRTSENPDYTIIMDCGVSDPQNSTVAMPIYGQTGVASSSSTSSYNTTGNSIYGSSNTTYTPSYGVVGAVPVTVTNYVRYFSLYIYKTSEVTGKNPEPVYGVQTTSVGPSGNITMVLPALIQGAFSEFPGNSGEFYHVSVSVNPKTGKPYSN